MNLVPNKQLLLKVPFQSTRYRKEELCMDNKVRETIGVVYCPTCRNEKCVYISTNKTTSFYDYEKCKACCNVLNIPFKEQKPTIMLFGGDGAHCFAKRTSRDYEKGKQSPFLKNFFPQSQPSTSELEPKRTNRVQIWNKRIRFLLGDDLSHILNLYIFLFNFNLHSAIQPYSTYIQLTKNYDLLSLQRRNPVDSWFLSRLCYYCSEWFRPKFNNQFTRNTPSCLAIAVVSEARFLEYSSATSANHSEPRGNNGD